MAETMLIRADASPQIGTGHVIRCLALAQVWQKSGDRALFAASLLPDPLRQRLIDEGMGIREFSAIPGGTEDSAAVVALVREHGAEAVVVDGYQFDAGYQQRLKEAGLRLLWVDDYGHARHYMADLILNQNLGASSALYAGRAPDTSLLLGARYVLLRQSFLKWRTWERTIQPEVKNILVTLGGSDPANVTLKIMQALPNKSGLEFTVVAGGSNPHLETLRLYCSANGARLIVNANNMAELMAQADLAISAGGTTVWELAFMGLPALLVTLADNQAASVEQLQIAGTARALGRPEQFNSEAISSAVTNLLTDAVARSEMSRRGRMLVDGDGAFRVWLRLKEHALRLHPAGEEDCKLLWEWANEPATRAVSFSSAPIRWEDHVRWFQARQRDPHCKLWIARDVDGLPVGQARIETANCPAVISVSLDRNRRGRNLGTLLIWLASRKLFRETTGKTVCAFIKPDNGASIHAFQKVGFEKVGRKEVNGQAALVFELTKGRAES